MRTRNIHLHSSHHFQIFTQLLLFTVYSMQYEPTKYTNSPFRPSIATGQTSKQRKDTSLRISTNPVHQPIRFTSHIPPDATPFRHPSTRPPFSSRHVHTSTNHTSPHRTTVRLSLLLIITLSHGIKAKQSIRSNTTSILHTNSSTIYNWLLIDSVNDDAFPQTSNFPGIHNVQYLRHVYSC